MPLIIIQRNPCEWPDCSHVNFFHLNQAVKVKAVPMNEKVIQSAPVGDTPTCFLPASDSPVIDCNSTMCEPGPKRCLTSNRLLHSIEGTIVSTE